MKNDIKTIQIASWTASGCGDRRASACVYIDVERVVTLNSVMTDNPMSGIAVFGTVQYEGYDAFCRPMKSGKFMEEYKHLIGHRVRVVMKATIADIEILHS